MQQADRDGHRIEDIFEDAAQRDCPRILQTMLKLICCLPGEISMTRINIHRAAAAAGHRLWINLLASDQ